MLGNRRKKPCPGTRDNFLMIAYDQTMNSEKTRLRKSFWARRSIRHKVPKIFKICGNSKFSRFYIRISLISFITRFKGNQWNPYIKSRKFWISENFENFGHLVTNWSPSSDTFSKSSFLWVHSLIICYHKKIVSRVRARFFLRFPSMFFFHHENSPNVCATYLESVTYSDPLNTCDRTGGGVNTEYGSRYEST